MRIEFKQDDKEAQPCHARLGGYQRMSGGTPIPVICTRPLGHSEHHTDQRDGVCLDWFTTTGPIRDPLSLGGFRLEPKENSSRQAQLRVIEDAVAEIINHPLTPVLDEGAQIRFKNIIVRHLARLL